MESKNKIGDNKVNKNKQNTDVVIKDNTKAQHESKYDSHSEGIPHQESIVSSDSNPDRVSNDNRDIVIKKEDSEEDDLEK